MYAYAANNPVKYTDPDGRTEDIPDWNILAKWEGATVHAKVEAYLLSHHGEAAEVPVIGGGKKEGSDGRADYIHGNEVYEIKPITQHALTEGNQQLQKYVDNINVPGEAVKGTSLLAELNGKSVGDITYNFPGICTYTKSYRLVTFKDPSQAGMIYYAERSRVDFSPLKQTVTDTANAL